jgi:Transglycosylase SLT domain
LAANNATVSTPLYPGRTICLPKGASAPTTTDAPASTSPVKVTPTTVKASTTTVAPTTTLPRPSYTAAEVEAIIRDVWPDDLEDEAVRIAKRESNLQPTARNACCIGLFQIYWTVHKGWLTAMGITTAEQLFDPRINATAGLALYQRSGGWGPWAL